MHVNIQSLLNGKFKGYLVELIEEFKYKDENLLS